MIVVDERLSWLADGGCEVGYSYTDHGRDNTFTTPSAQSSMPRRGELSFDTPWGSETSFGKHGDSGFIDAFREDAAKGPDARLDPNWIPSVTKTCCVTQGTGYLVHGASECCGVARLVLLVMLRATSSRASVHSKSFEPTPKNIKLHKVASPN